MRKIQADIDKEGAINLKEYNFDISFQTIAIRPGEPIDFDFRIPKRIGSFTAETIRIDPFFNFE